MLKSTLFTPAAGVAVLVLSILLGSTAYSGSSAEQAPGEKLPIIDRSEENRTYGLPLANFSDRELKGTSDLYSPSLTVRPGAFDLHSPELNSRLVADRIVPLAKVRALGWPTAKRSAFGHDLENISLTSHWANSWKSISGPAELQKAALRGNFSWTDGCAQAYYSRLMPQSPGCRGLPEDFNGPRYAQSYESIAKRYEVPVSSEDRAALSYFKSH